MSERTFCVCFLFPVLRIELRDQSSFRTKHSSLYSKPPPFWNRFFVSSQIVVADLKVGPGWCQIARGGATSSTLKQGKALLEWKTVSVRPLSLCVCVCVCVCACACVCMCVSAPVRACIFSFSVLVFGLKWLFCLIQPAPSAHEAGGRRPTPSETQETSCSVRARSLQEVLHNPPPRQTVICAEPLPLQPLRFQTDKKRRSEQHHFTCQQPIALCVLFMIRLRALIIVSRLQGKPSSHHANL